MIAKNTICLWYEHDAEQAARFCAQTFPDSSVGAVHHAPHLSLHQPHALSCPPLPAIAFQ